MKKSCTYIMMAGLVASSISFTNCGGGGSASSATTTGGASDPGVGTASVKTLASIPSVDLANLDLSTGSTTTNLAVRKAISKDFKDALNKVGGSSRAGCEANMHKQEMIRMSQEAQLDRCYPEAMETVGVITIPEANADGTGYAIYKIKPPNGQDKGGKQVKFEQPPGGGGPGGDHQGEGGPGGDQGGGGQQGGGSSNQKSPCDNIPSDHTDEIAACKGGEGAGDKGMLMKIGRIGNALKIYMCEGTDTPTLVNESSYTADGSKYTMVTTRKGTFNGHTEGSTINVVVDLGTTGSVTDDKVDLGTDGTAKATGIIDGGFGKGSQTFEANAADDSNIVSGVFSGDFKDPQGNQTTFTGKVYSQFGGATKTGTAQFGFTGKPPPMKVSNMIPPDMATDQQDNFLLTFGSQLGATITADSLLCPNPDFDPQHPDQNTAGIPPMKVLEDGVTECEEVSNTGVESFSITNGTVAGNYGDSVEQTFAIIANADSAFFDAVDAFDLSTLSLADATVALSGDWDCTGTATELDFAVLMADSSAATTIETAMKSCQAIEEKARGNQGMGGYNCNQQQQQNGVNEISQQKPEDSVGGGRENGFGGPFRNETAKCGLDTVPDHIFINPASAGKYCISTNGKCSEFDAVVGAPIPVDVSFGDLKIDAIQFDAQPPEVLGAHFANTAHGACTALYNREEMKFDPSAAHGGKPGDPPPLNGQGVGTQQCVLAKACTDAYGDKANCGLCGDFCNKDQNHRDACKPQ